MNISKITVCWEGSLLYDVWSEEHPQGSAFTHDSLMAFLSGVYRAVRATHPDVKGITIYAIDTCGFPVLGFLQNRITNEPMVER